MIKKIALSLVGLIVVFLLIFKGGLLNVSNVHVQTLGVLCADSNHISETVNVLGKNILTVNKNTISENIKSRFPCVGQVEVEKNFPRTISIIVNNRVAITRVVPYKNIDNFTQLEASPSSSSALIDWSLPPFSDLGLVVDSEGYVFQDSGASLPVLYFPLEIIKIGDKLESDSFQKIAQLIQGLENLKLDNNLLQFKLSGSNLLLINNPKIAFSLNKDVKIQLASLQLILQKNTIDGKKMESVDLRFDKPVVVYTSQTRS